MRSRLLTLPCVSLAALAVLGLPGAAQADVPAGPAAPIGGPSTGLGGLGDWNDGWLPPVVPGSGDVVGTGVDAECGQPAVPPVYGTHTYPAVYTHVPAVTRTAWLWQRTVPTVEIELVAETAPATGTYAWTRSLSHLERQYLQKVVITDAVPAVPAVEEQWHWETVVVTPAQTRTEVEYKHLRTGKLRWERAGWNGGDDDDHDNGWVVTGRTRQVETTPAVTERRRVVDVPAKPAVPAVPAVTKDVLSWVRDGEAAPKGSEPTGQTRTVVTTESRELPAGETPAGDGWVRGAFTVTSPATTDTIWVREGAAAPEGYTATGEERPGAGRVERSDVPSSEAPEGEGWAQVDGSDIEIVVADAYERLDEPARVVDFIVSPGIPATDDCPVEPVDGTDGTDEGDDEGDDEGEDGGEVDVVLDAAGGVPGIAADAPGEVLAAVDVAPAAAAPAAVLPQTGGSVDPWLVLAGAGSLVAGAALVRRSREA